MSTDPAARQLRKQAAEIKAEYEQTKIRYQESVNKWSEQYPRISGRLFTIQNRRLNTARRHRDYLLARLTGARRDEALEEELYETDKREVWDLYAAIAEVEPGFSATTAHAEYCVTIDAARAARGQLYQAVRSEMIDYGLDTREPGTDPHTR